MSDEWEIEPMYRVYDNDAGACIEFRVCPDFPGNVLMSTPDKTSAEYYGEIRISMPIGQAKKICDALGKQIFQMGES